LVDYPSLCPTRGTFIAYPLYGHLSPPLTRAGPSFCFVSPMACQGILLPSNSRFFFLDHIPTQHSSLFHRWFTWSVSHGAAISTRRPRSCAASSSPLSSMRASGAARCVASKEAVLHNSCSSTIQELRAKLLPVADKSKEIDRERRERAKVRKRTKSALGAGAGKEVRSCIRDLSHVRLTCAWPMCSFFVAGRRGRSHDRCHPCCRYFRCQRCS